MTNLPQPSEPDPRTDLRASDSDREAVAERLREAAGDGRLDLDELQERLDRTFAAKTYGQLVPLVSDLPEGAGFAAEAEREEQDQPPVVITGGGGGDVRKGYWKVPPRILVRGGIGGVKLDFTQAELRGRSVEIQAHGEVGGVVLVLPEGWNFELDHSEAGLSGVTNKATRPPTPGAPTVHAHCSGGIGGIVVRYPNWWEQRQLRKKRG